MIFIVFAVLTGAAIFSVLWPLRARVRAAPPENLPVVFYQAQLAAIARDLEAGLVSVADAELARTEAARRVLGDVAVPVTDERRGAAFAAAIAALIGVPVVAFGLYNSTGSPGLPDAPLAKRLAAAAEKSAIAEAPPEKSDIMAMIAKIEAHLALQPDDGRGFQLIAPIYMRLGRSADAANAYARVLQLLGDTPERRADHAEAVVAAADGNVSSDAKAEFEAALQKQTDLPKARFYLGLAAQQAGDTIQALDIWTKLLADAAPDAPYVRVVQARIAALDPKSAATQSPANAIVAMPAPERDAAIRSMVDGLAQRLAQKGGDVEAWLRLIRAYNVLHEAQLARAAWADAQKSMAGDTAALQRLNNLARELGLEGS